jgi:hypothetical protein
VSDRRILRRAQWGTLAAGTAVGLAVGLFRDQQFGLAIGVGSVWSGLNLRILEGLLSVAIVPRDQEKQIGRVFIWSAAKLGIYVVAVWLLIVAPFPVAGMAIGLTIMLAALVLAGLTTRHRTTVQEAPRRGDDVEA